MNISNAIDTICSYLNFLASFFSTIQRLKNEFHAKDIDYTLVLTKLLTDPKVDPVTLGAEIELGNDHENILLSALVSLTVYRCTSSEDWTSDITPTLQSTIAHSPRDPWRRGKLKPTVIDLHGSHYMTSSKPQVFLATYRKSKSIVLSLPGTNSRSDWLSNLHSGTTDLIIDGQTVKVHEGFLYIAQCLNTHKSIQRYLSDALDSGITKILLCGHSQAGAVVSLLSILLESDFKLGTNVVTFGSGACARTSGLRADRYASFIRCVEKDPRDTAAQGWQIDPVPFLDDAVLSDSDGPVMCPFGTIYTILERGEACQVRKLGSRQMRVLLHRVLLNFSADPHSMKGYLHCILSQMPVRSKTDVVPVSGSSASSGLVDVHGDERSEETQQDSVRVPNHGELEGDFERRDDMVARRQLLSEERSGPMKRRRLGPS